MNGTTQEVLTVDGINQYGIKVGGKTYSISTRLAQSGITPQSFQVGSRIRAEIWTGPQGGKKINSFELEGAVAQAQAPVYQAPPQMPPSLPPTSLAQTQAPGGAPPVSKTPRAATSGDEDKMSKADWAARNNEIAIQAVLKSSIESPVLAEHVTGKSTAEVFELQRRYFKENLESYRLACQGLLS